MAKKMLVFPYAWREGLFMDKDPASTPYTPASKESN
jgi:hypothetical protein